MCKTSNNKIKCNSTNENNEPCHFNINTYHVQNALCKCAQKSYIIFAVFFPQTDVATVDLTADTV